MSTNMETINMNTKTGKQARGSQEMKPVDSQYLLRYCEAMNYSYEFVKRAIDSHEVLTNALKEAQSYILRLKGQEFNVKNSNYFHITVVLNEALKLAEEA